MAQKFYDSNYSLGQAYMEVMREELASQKPQLAALADDVKMKSIGDHYERIILYFTGKNDDKMRSILIKDNIPNRTRPIAKTE